MFLFLFIFALVVRCLRLSSGINRGFRSLPLLRLFKTGFILCLSRGLLLLLLLLGVAIFHFFYDLVSDRLVEKQRHIISILLVCVVLNFSINHLVVQYINIQSQSYSVAHSNVQRAVFRTVDSLHLVVSCAHKFCSYSKLSVVAQHAD